MCCREGSGEGIFFVSGRAFDIINKRYLSGKELRNFYQNKVHNLSGKEAVQLCSLRDPFSFAGVRVHMDEGDNERISCAPN